MPFHRLGARLARLLLHNVAAQLGQLLHNVAAQLCSALQATAKCMATHTPLSHEMVECVLLSPDLVPHILGPLEAEDAAAAAVCSQWLAGWKATNGSRPMKHVPIDFSEAYRQELSGGSNESPLGERNGRLQMAGTPDGRLVVGARTEVRILDRSMHVLQTLAGRVLQIFAGDVLYDDYTSIAANDESIFYTTVIRGELHRCTLNGTIAAEYQLEDYSFYSPVLAPGGLLFCLMREEKPDAQSNQDEIIALDAQTLELRHHFGLGLLKDAHQLVVVADELYVCDTGNDRLQVFSLTGEHRRSVTGEWISPLLLCFANDRLYLVEREDDGDEDDDDDYGDPLRGRRLLVLSLQGDILQVVTNPSDPSEPGRGLMDAATFTSIFCFDRKLLVSYKYREHNMGPRWGLGVPWRCGMLALQLQGL